MADLSALTTGFQQGMKSSLDYRERRQIERAREYALKKMGQEDFAFGENQKMLAGDIKNEFGDVDTNVYQHDGLKDPLAFRLLDWFKKRKQGVVDPSVQVGDLEQAAPAASAEQQVTAEDPQAFADGGDVSEEEKIRQRAAQNRARSPGRVQQQTETVQGADRTASKAASSGRSALKSADEAAGKFANTRPLANEATGLGRVARGARNVARGAKGLGAAGALAGTGIDVATTPTEQYRERFGLETNDPSLLGDIGVRALGAASDLGNVLTFGQAGKLYRDKQRIAAEGQQDQMGMDDMGEVPMDEAVPQDVSASLQSRRSALDTAGDSVGGGGAIDFGSMQEVAPEEVPNMSTDDWRHYRLEALRSAMNQGLDPVTAKEQVNDQITRMQQKGFLSYAQQGLMLQQAGNINGAMAAYRAAYQYFPNDFDVEFGTVNHGGRQMIVGFGTDEKTGQRVPGTEMVMDPERMSTMIENFANPSAFRAWTKDWRDYNFEEKKYNEVTKPLAEAQGAAGLMNAQAALGRADAAGAGGGYKQADMRGDAALFRDAPGMQEMMLQDPAQAQYLMSVMGRIKQARPQLPPDAVASAVMNAVQQGNLEQWLQRLGIVAQASISTPTAPQGAPPAAAAPPRTSAMKSRPTEPVSAERPPGFPDAVWERALRDNGGNAARAAAMLSESNQYAP